jgi:hypothetical protein
MDEAPSRSVRLFGTEEAIEPPRLLTAGPLTAEFEGGNLRYIRFDGAEMLRAVSFIVRDKNWGTYNPAITGLTIVEDSEGFRVSYDAVAHDGSQAFKYSAEMTGRPDGTLRFEAEGVAATDFLTNRTGFVVLHPITGVAGQPARIETVDGQFVDTHFPEMINPVQPMMGLRAITHSFASGASVTCRMEGDTYEMEDQRNWTDASYKTYVRPLALPWPYTLEAGAKLEQAVSLTVSGRSQAARRSGGPIAVRLGRTLGRVPQLGLGLDPDDAEETLAKAEVLRAIGPAHLICHYDPRRGHGRRELSLAVEVAAALGAKPWLEAIVAEVDEFEREIGALGRMVRDLGVSFPVVMASPASDLKCTLPGSPWPPCPPAVPLYSAIRRAFPDARIGGGMFSYFTELNRKRPPLEQLDFVSFTTSPLVHAGDDRSVTESLEALPHIARSVRNFIGERPYAVGPSAIGMRDNPYGEAPMPNPGNIRQAMNRNDPRQRGLLGAAWCVGCYAHFAYGGAEAIALGGAIGPFGLVHAPMPFPQPWFDRHGGLYPAFHIVRGLASLTGASLIEVSVSAPRNLQALAVRREGGAVELWLANLTGEKQQVSLDPSMASASIAVLDDEGFVAATHSPEAMDHVEKAMGGSEINLGPYAVGRVRSLK